MIHVYVNVNERKNTDDNMGRNMIAKNNNNYEENNYNIHHNQRYKKVVNEYCFNEIQLSH